MGSSLTITERKGSRVSQALARLRNGSRRICGFLYDCWHYKRFPTWLCRIAYITSAVNPFLSVMENDYTGIRRFRPLLEWRRKNPVRAMPHSVYTSLFYFARLKPRLLFTIGACLRALQQTTLLQYLLIPVLVSAL